MFEKIAEIINQYEKKGDFTHAEVRDEIIFSAEKRLGAKLPEAYQWFLLIKRYSLDHMGYPVK